MARPQTPKRFRGKKSDTFTASTGVYLLGKHVDVGRPVAGGSARPFTQQVQDQSLQDAHIK
eukprot:203316-Pelagomonas_calceolata.AAC.3